MKTKVLHVLGSLDYKSGGPLRAVLDLSAMSLPLGLHSEILGIGEMCIPDNPLSASQIHSLRAIGPASYGYAPSVRKWCRENLHRFDIVMLHGMWNYPNWVVSRECLASGVPYVAFPHGMLDLWSVHGQGSWKKLKKTLYWYWRERRIVKNSASVFFTLQRELDNAQKTFKLPSIVSCIVVPYGMTPSPSRALCPQSERVAQSSEKKIGLFLGRVDPKKRPDLLIEAWAAAELTPEWRLVIAGPGEPAYVSSLLQLARRRGIEPYIQFTGPVAGADKQYLLARASWFLLPSEQENFGVAVLEAVRAGCAVAISDQVYLADEFPPHSEVLPVQLDAWVQFMRERMTNDVWRDETAQRAQNHLTPKYQGSRVASGWADAIVSVAGRQTCRIPGECS